MMQTYGDHETFYIGGQWVRSDSLEVPEVCSPATEEIIGRVPVGSEQDIDRAVRAACDAFDHLHWPRLTMAERAKLCKKHWPTAWKRCGKNLPSSAPTNPGSQF
jgi:acyl-CoA reductase-like NAD-dependent aldehyde dehydrogenase